MTVQRFLFIFGFESPGEWRSNDHHGDDAESSDAVWIQASSEAAAIEAGKSYAQSKVGDLFRKAGIADYPGWRESGYAHWIEADPYRRWSGRDLDELPRIRTDEI